MFVIEVPYFNLNHIYNSGQVPRWIKLKESKYVICHKDKALKIEQKENDYKLKSNRLYMNCSEEEFFNIWFDYLGLKMDCMYENTKIKRLGKKFKIPANRGNGIHIIKQDPFEAYVLSKLIGFVGYKKAGELMNRIAHTYGIVHKQSMREAGRVTWYEWPSPEVILEKLNSEKQSSGKVKPFLKKLCNAIVNEGFDITQTDYELFKLFGLHDTSVFPLVGIEETLVKNFDENPEDFADWYLDEIENKGLVYMYIVHHILNKQQEMIMCGAN